MQRILASMKLPQLSRFTKFGMVGLGVLFLAWIGLTFFAESESKRTEAIVKDEKRCPTCNRRLSQAAIERNVCPYCLLEHGEEAAKIRKGGSLATSKVIPIAIVGVFVLLLVANVVVAMRGRLKQGKEEVFFHYNCPKCRRKLRYRERQIGSLARCPLCERPIVFPKPAAWPETRWTKLRRWLHLDPARQA
jgi:hypothetical protein